MMSAILLIMTIVTIAIGPVVIVGMILILVSSFTLDSLDVYL